ncbi:TIGR02265 family protein [Archangium violaceum]|uniref:TIGR02265 family protein n=1 Tax=Archangium violaceum TaxID=83451 RepID=UPI001951F9DE|nr:TIGR02265 family protein [Archangium violaceum]QRO02008.1 TIGR02265 family protein [Archangium violaceum]
MIGNQASCDEDSGLGTKEELQRRLSLATPTDTVRGFAINNTLGALRQDLGSEAVAHCLHQVEHKSFHSFFNYPVSDHLRVQYTTAWMLSERYGGFDAAVRRIARGLAPEFLSSVVGRAFLALTQQGPKQLIEHVPMAFRAVATFGEGTVRWTSPKSGVLTTKRDFLLYVSHEGGLMSLFRTLKIQGAWVRGRQVGPLANEVEFSWD